MTNIYELSKELEDFLLSLPETGELDDEALARYSEINGEIEDKIKSTTYAYFNLTSEIEAIMTQIERIKKLKESKDRQAERVKKLIDFGMRLNKLDKLDFGDAKISYTKSTGTVIDDESLVPEEYKKTKTVVSVDIAKAKEALKNGVAVEGIHLEERSNLQIK
jgi:alpha-N-acetylglucosamine transferase